MPDPAPPNSNDQGDDPLARLERIAEEAERAVLEAATAAELEDLPGIGPATSAAILDERARRGRFGAVDDLLDVPGIGEAKLEGLRDLVRV